jgi:CheY-like chemotaxis protein
MTTTLSPVPGLPPVLIVDDDPESLLLVGTMLDYLGYPSVRAAHYDEALERLLAGPSALVLDLVMPGQTSERLLAELQRTGNPIPVVLMSATQRETLGALALEHARHGVNIVSTLAKPFWVDVLVSALERAIPDAPHATIDAG